MLITHQGLSGPAILQISSYWERGKRSYRSRPRDAKSSHRSANPRREIIAAARSALQVTLPNRFATRWLDAHSPPGWTNEDLVPPRTANCTNGPSRPPALEGFDKAEVTAGGIDTDELSSKTMESRKVPGLFFIGEVVDVTGHLGGFNFQWAWSSAAAAGRAL